MPPDFLDGVTLVSILGIIGAAIKFAWDRLVGRIDKRAADLDARERAFEESRDARVGILDAQVQRLADRLQTITDLVGRQRTAIHLLVARIARDEPTAPELALVEKLLGDEFPAILRADDPQPFTPHDIAAKARAITDD